MASPASTTSFRSLVHDLRCSFMSAWEGLIDWPDFRTTAQFTIAAYIHNRVPSRKKAADFAFWLALACAAISFVKWMAET